MSFSAAATWKSSNTFCLCSRIPARCQSSPSSLPPRSPAIAYTPPASTQARIDAEKAGVMLILNPPYPYRMAGRLGPGTRSAAAAAAAARRERHGVRGPRRPD